MITKDQTKTIMYQLEALATALRNGNVEQSTVYIDQLGNFLNQIWPLDWMQAAQFFINLLPNPTLRATLLSFLPDLMAVLPEIDNEPETPE